MWAKAMTDRFLLARQEVGARLLLFAAAQTPLSEATVVSEFIDNNIDDLIERHTVIYCMVRPEHPAFPALKDSLDTQINVLFLYTDLAGQQWSKTALYVTRSNGRYFARGMEAGLSSLRPGPGAR
jgi:hypothetical protein